jgi:hypothetical protein
VLATKKRSSLRYAAKVGKQIKNDWGFDREGVKDIVLGLNKMP